jgi:hypothetical protein
LLHVQPPMGECPDQLEDAPRGEGTLEVELIFPERFLTRA